MPVRPYVQTLGEGEGESQGNPTGRRKIRSFLGGKSRGALEQPAAFFLGELHVIVDFETEVS